MAQNKKPAVRTASAASMAPVTEPAQAQAQVPFAGGMSRNTANKPDGKPAAAAKTTTPTTAMTPQIKTTLNHEQIAKRAFAIWVAKGRPTGADVQNWKEAEAALHQEMAKRA